jgi:nucleotide-binding universal stress UspA family protein
MFQRLLVPLDGSSLAEAILPAAKSLGRRLGARVTLLHAVEPSAPATIHGDTHLLNASDARAYLARITQQFQHAGVAVDWHVDVVESGNVPKTIFAHTAELKADLVMLTSHGESGLRGIVFGSIAQQVLQSGKVPVFMVRPENAHTDFAPKTILVPLDSSELYEPALYLAAELARYYDASLHLVVVVPTMSTLSPARAATGLLLPSSTKAMLDLARNGAVEYLQKKIDELRARGVIVSAEVERGATAAKILEAAQRAGVDLFVMATHGRAGLDAFWEGSVAPQILSHAKAPVLLLRVEGPEPVR